MWRKLKRALSTHSSVLPDSDAIHAFFAAKFAGGGVTQPLVADPVPSQEEVEGVVNHVSLAAALKRVKRSASPGIPGVPVQAFSMPRIRNLVLALLQAMYKAGWEPICVQEGLLVFVYKRGDRLIPGNYRPIMVSCVLHKILANIVTDQLHLHVSDSHDLLPRHCGFIPARGTLHNLFVLQHAIHHAVGHKESLHVMLVDVAAAYDCANHQLLLDTLASQQVPNHVIRMVRGMYSGLRCQIQSPSGGRLPGFPITVGVKQGCPASPLLYCLYVQSVSTALAGSGIPGMYCLMQSDDHSMHPHPDWAYADDVTLLAHSVEGLQQLVTAASTIFSQKHLQLQPHKCVVLHVHASEGDVHINGCQVPVAPATGTRYLGLMYDTRAHATLMAQHRAKCMLSSAQVIRAQLHGTDDVPTCFTSIMQLLKVSVFPAGLYGCEIWGLLSIQSWSKHLGFPSINAFYSMADPLEKSRAEVLRRWFHLPKGTPLICLLHELGLEPLVHCYIRRSVRLWNCLAAMDRGSPYRDALSQNVSDGLSNRLRNFSCALFMVLRFIMQQSGEGIRLLVSKMMDLECIDEELVDRAICVTYYKYVDHLASVRSGDGSMKGFYFREVGKHEVGELPCWYTFKLPHGCLLRMLRFRLGQHHLSINIGRRLIPKPPKEQRICRRCYWVGSAVDDEDHCVAVCPCPTLQRSRQDLLRTLRSIIPGATITSFGGLCTTTEYLHHHNHHRLKHKCVLFLAKCYKEAHKCFQSPHTYVGAEPEFSFQGLDELDDYNSEGVLVAHDVVTHDGLDDDEYASELEEILSPS